MPRLGVVFAVVALLGVAACGDDVESGTASISIESPVVVVPSGANTALYMTIVNDGDGADALTEVRSQVADEAQLHRTTEGDDGLTRMEPVDELEVEAGGSAVFEPGGLHVMLLGVDDLVAGDQVEIELVFAESGPIDVQAEVRAISDVVD